MFGGWRSTPNLLTRAKHRGTGGIYFDDVPVLRFAANLVMDMVTGWMPSCLPIVSRNRDREYTEEIPQIQSAVLLGGEVWSRKCQPTGGGGDGVGSVNDYI